jgi:hypothetical protein
MVTSADFKKIKAKVGKRAPVKANVTDTSFKSVGLHISKQVGISNLADQNESANITTKSATTTRRGLTLHQLLLQLKHPTLAVRMSAVKGLKSLLTTSAALNQQMKLHLSEIIASLAPACCVDEDPTVRKAAIQTFQELIVHLNYDSDHASSQTMLLPFVPYLMAIIATALNALDMQQRYDGAIMVRWLIETVFMDSKSSPVASVGMINSALIQFIPPLTRVFGVTPNGCTIHKERQQPSGDDVTTNGTCSSASNSNAFISTMMQVGSMKKNKKNKKRKRSPQPQPPQRQPQQSSKSTMNNGGNNTIVTLSPDSSNPKIVVLMAIHTLLRVAAVPDCNHRTLAFNEVDDKSDNGKSLLAHDLVINYGQLQSSLIFVDNVDRMVQRPHVQYPIYSLTDFPSWQQFEIHPLTDEDDDDDNRTTTHTNHSSNRGYTALTMTETLDLMTKLRDYVIEAAQSQDSYPFLLCVTTARLVLEYKDICSGLRNMTPSNTSNLDDVTRQLLKLCSQIGSCIVECFSMYERNSNHVAELSRTLLCLAITVQQWSHPHQPRSLPSIQLQKQPKSDKYDALARQWIELVALHIQSSLEDDDATIVTIGESSSCNSPGLDFEQANRGEDMPSSSLPSLVMSTATLSVLAQLLLRNDMRPNFELQVRLTDLFCTVFFNVERPLPTVIVCSEVGRSAVLLGCRLISANGYSMERLSKFLGQNTVSDILQCIPRFLPQWHASYLSTTETCLSTLQHVVRRIDCSNVAESSNINCLTKLQTGIESLLLGSTSSDDCSIFEVYPELLQRQVVCLLCMSGAPTALIVKRFAEVCARCYSKSGFQGQSCTVSTTVSSFITQYIHNVRETIPMNLYVAFLVDSTSLMKLDYRSVSRDQVLTLTYAVDVGMRCVSTCLVDCGTKNVLPMLEALVSVLVNKVNNESKENGHSTSLVCLVQARAALCLLAVFSVDLKAIDGFSADTSVFHCVSSQLHESVVSCIVYIMSIGIDRIFESTQNATVIRWLLPIISLFVSEQNLMARVFERVVSAFDDVDMATQSHVLEVWLYVFKEPQLKSTLNFDGRTIMEHIQRNLLAAENRSPIVSAERLLAELEVRCHNMD